MEIKVLMIGFGHVGRGFADLLLKKEKILKEQYDLQVKVIGIITRSHGTVIDEQGLNLGKVLKTTQAGQPVAGAGFPVSDQSTEYWLETLDYDVLAELSITNLQNGEPATSYIKAALQRAKHVITTNKGPVALYLPELQKLSQSKGVQFRFEGTVMAGTPLLNLIHYNLAGLQINKIQGIVNGSTNYILTRMEQGMSYADAVGEAKALGYLEADPTADVEGWDAVAKTMILSAAVFKQPLTKEQIRRKGITHLRQEDVKAAEAQGKVWKLIATLEQREKGLLASVQPELLEKSHPLASVHGATNAVIISTDFLPDVTIVGPGAGEYETGYSVLNDLINLSREIAVP